MGETIRRRVVVRGRVQGVWFRKFTKDEAVAQVLRGWVRNCADGSVEAVAEGPADALERWLDALRVGPRLAIVRELDVRPEDDPRESFSEFGVR